MQDKYYYVEEVHDKNIVTTFKPHIPQFRIGTENNKISRICLGKNLLSCLNAASFRSDLNETAFVYRLYVFEGSQIKKENLIESVELFETSLVPDAYLTEEVWVINQDLIPCEINYFTINYYDMEEVPIFKTIKEYEEFYKNSLIDSGCESYMHFRDVDISFIEENDICHTMSLEIRLTLDDILDKETLDSFTGTLEDQIESILPDSDYIEIYESFHSENECSWVLTNNGFYSSSFSLSKFEQELSTIWDCKSLELKIIGG